MVQLLSVMNSAVLSDLAEIVLLNSRLNRITLQIKDLLYIDREGWEIKTALVVERHQLIVCLRIHQSVCIVS